jgi:hypothetical protein
MAAEIIDAGRFDQQTTNAERKETLEQILGDETRSRIAKNEARPLQPLLLILFQRRLRRAT